MPHRRKELGGKILLVTEPGILNTSGAPAHPKTPGTTGIPTRRAPKSSHFESSEPQELRPISASFEQCTQLEEVSSLVKVLQSKINLIKLVRIWTKIIIYSSIIRFQVIL